MRFEKSQDTKILESVLKGIEVGQTVTYEQLSKAIGRDVREHARSSLDTARRGVLKLGIVFDVEQNVGLVRLNDAQIVNSTERDRKSISRKARHTLNKLSVAKYENLDDEAKRKHVTMSAQMGALQMFSAKSTTSKIESKVSNDTKELPIGETLKLFGAS
jgi:hypothetical protein